MPPTKEQLARYQAEKAAHQAWMHDFFVRHGLAVTPAEAQAALAAAPGCATTQDWKARLAAKASTNPGLRRELAELEALGVRYSVLPPNHHQGDAR